MTDAQHYAMAKTYNEASQVRVPSPASTGFYIVPVFGTYGYQSLTGERVGMLPSATGYFTLGTAYGSCGMLQPTTRPTMAEHFEEMPKVQYGTPYVRSACM